MDTLKLAGVIIGGVALLFAAKTYSKNFVKKPNEERQHLLLQFKANQTLARQVKDSLIEYAQSRNAFDAFMFQGVTYRTYIAELETCLTETNLADKYYDSLKTLDLTSSNIQAMLRSLEAQFESLSQLQTNTRLLSR